MKPLLLALMGTGLWDGTPPPIKLLCIVLSITIIVVIGLSEKSNN
jgi:hypothetical protein